MFATMQSRRRDFYVQVKCPTCGTVAKVRLDRDTEQAVIKCTGNKPGTPSCGTLILVEISLSVNTRRIESGRNTKTTEAKLET